MKLESFGICREERKDVLRTNTESGGRQLRYMKMVGDAGCGGSGGGNRKQCGSNADEDDERARREAVKLVADYRADMKQAVLQTNSANKRRARVDVERLHQ